MNFLLKAVAVYGIVAGGIQLLAKAVEPKDKPTQKKTRTVYLIGSPVEFRGFRIPKPIHDYIIGKCGVTLAGIVHWGVVVRDQPEDGAPTFFTQWDLWSAWPPLKNKLRKRLVTENIKKAYTHSDEVGKTSKTDEEMNIIAERILVQYPTYGLKGNCQHFATKFLSEVCDITVIPIGSLESQLRKISPDLDAFELVTHFFDRTVLRIGRNEEADLRRVKEKLMEDEL